MDNFVSNEKFKEKLEIELDNIIEQRKIVYEQVKNLQVSLKVYYILNNRVKKFC
jgi:hypothetical protein